MADMIESKEAKQILECDEATLIAHINKGTIRAQRVGGKLLLNQDDVEKLRKEDDGTIVLTGDSDNLQIDLGKVVDDTSETISQPAAGQAAGRKSGEDSITFGDELEVVNFDDGKTAELKATPEKTGTAALPKPALNFTDSNTAVVTAVEDTHVGGTTSSIGVTTEIEGAQQDSPNQGEPNDSRRSVRSNRARAEVASVHWAWFLVLLFTLLFGLFLVAPYYFLANATRDEKDAAGNQARGTSDTLWQPLTSSFPGGPGFTIEPDKTKFLAENPGAEYRDIADVDRNGPNGKATWRYQAYRGKGIGNGPEAKRIADFDIVRVEGDKAVAKSGKTYPLIKQGEDRVTIDVWAK